MKPTVEDRSAVWHGLVLRQILQKKFKKNWFVLTYFTCVFVQIHSMKLAQYDGIKIFQLPNVGIGAYFKYAFSRFISFQNRRTYPFYILNIW